MVHDVPGILKLSVTLVISVSERFAELRTRECAYLPLSHCRFSVMGIGQSHCGLKTNITVIHEADKDVKTKSG